MLKTINVPQTEWDRLVERVEDLEDELSVHDYTRRRANPDWEDNLFASEDVARVVAGESAVRVYRERRGLTQAELAKRAGVSRAMIADIETGRASGSLHTAMSIATALGYTLDDLFAREA